jgi:hypothetical protein
MSVEDRAGDAVVGDREHANIGFLAHVSEELNDASGAILARTEVWLSQLVHVGRIGGLEQDLDDCLEPVEDFGSLADSGVLERTSADFGAVLDSAQFLDSLADRLPFIA